ncbi:hypothetical protein DDE82_008540 [Stemphylium lycopersici]|nr:hypothetical protein DDE82_008540 [Stemphylium lycopersici]
MTIECLFRRREVSRAILH